MNGDGGQQSRGDRHVQLSIEIDAGVARVFGLWSDFERLPRLMEGVRRAKRIGERCVLWDADVSGRQVVWEAEIVEQVPEKRIRWRSTWGAPNAGEVSFDELPGGRTRLQVSLRYRPRGVLEHVGAALGMLRARIARDLAQFRRAAERLSPGHHLA